MQKQLNIPFSLEGQQDITNLKDINESFASGTLKIMYLGKNRNGSSFTKEAVLNALPSLYNVPIVANYVREEDEIKGHDIDIVRKGDDIVIVNATQPCGVIPEHAKFRFEILFDSSGECHEYLVADDVILWKRQEVYDVLMTKYEGEISHSMEISVNDMEYDEDSSAFNITDFQFTALCLLGENCPPCFEGSALQINNAQMFSLSMNEMLSELKKTFASLKIDNDEVKGGEDMSEVNHEYEAEKNVEPEVAEEVIEETAEEKFDEEAEAEVVETAAEETEEIVLSVDADYAAEACSAIEEAVKAEGNYWMLTDMFDSESNVHNVMLQSKSDYRAYAVKAVYENGSLTIDWENPEAKGFAVVDIEHPTSHTDLPGTQKLIEENGTFSAKVIEFEEQMPGLNEELESLREYKAAIEGQKLIESRNELLSRFADIANTEECEQLMEKADEYDLETLEEKLYAIRGKKANVGNFSAKPAIGVRLGIGKKDKSNEPYGNLFAKYKVEGE